MTKNDSPTPNPPADLSNPSFAHLDGYLSIVSKIAGRLAREKARDLGLLTERSGTLECTTPTDEHIQ